ncbi:MAG TPA: transposase, partial [Dissulfurispiraceae bacterium]|nr:transposase [Dissulfurispiraceae bacterium]
RKAEEVARSLDYSIHSIHAMKKEFAKAVESGSIDAEYFFITHMPGRRVDEGKAKTRDRILELRMQNYSILDIKSVLHTEGQMVSHDYIHRVLRAEGFARIARRTQVERKIAASKVLKAPRSEAIDWAADKGLTFHSERGIGILPFLPLLAWLGVQQWIEEAGFPETNELSRTHNVLSFIALKLSGHSRYSHDDLWAMDRGFGLFSGLNVLPKDSTLSSYSYRVTRQMNRRFLTAMFHRLRGLGVLGGDVNMDFTAIPHWGDASVLENHWSGKRGKALKSVLAAVCQDPDTGIACYGDAEMRNHDKADCVLEFIDFWKQSGEGPRCLIFDSQFTTYQNLAKLDVDHIKFITIRRRHKRLLKELSTLSKDAWQEMRLEGVRKHEKVRIHDSEIKLPKIGRPFRQLIVADNGHQKETFLITNDRDRTAQQIVRQYGKRWNIEKGISEQIEFFHLNSLSSSIVIKVDFDLTMTIAAHNFYRMIARSLAGFEDGISGSLNNKFFQNGGQFTINNDTIVIEMKKKRHLPILLDALTSYQETAIPWLEDRKLIFRPWAVS